MTDNKKVEYFKKELLDLLKKYNYSISHEDTQGGFILANYNDYDNNWLLDFSDYNIKED